MADYIHTPSPTASPALQAMLTHSGFPLTESRSQSPISRVNSPIDMDGLSWPSRFPVLTVGPFFSPETLPLFFGRWHDQATSDAIPTLTPTHSTPGLGTKARRDETKAEAEERIRKMSGAVRTLLECMGEDPDREGLLKTPERYAKALMFFSKGYEENVRDVLNGAIFEEDHDEMVIVKNVEVFSLCEHHMVPFTGKIHIAYIPNRKVVGLSKLARIAEMFGRRLQVQERLTKQIAMALMEILKPQGVAVVMEARCIVFVFWRRIGLDLKNGQ
ncbi:GTP cyclohydrolase I [Jimgerdemannia flammicorona]|uniref:GTP cyclohydrolase 1 n=1 Tax=Jimgerdemannia flammicorona TaxID=994334 RepID=A0A433QWU0_9FUNG|nr:GTP cyclohydrolase I [Jimgerdemannia flammicorona]